MQFVFSYIQFMISEVRVSHAGQIGMHEFGFLYTFTERNRKTTVTFPGLLSADAGPTCIVHPYRQLVDSPRQ